MWRIFIIVPLAVMYLIVNMYALCKFRDEVEGYHTFKVVIKEENYLFLDLNKVLMKLYICAVENANNIYLGY